MRTAREVRLASVCVSMIAISLMFSGTGHAVVDFKTCIGMWLFDEDGDDAAEDSSLNDNSAVVRDAKWVDGKFGGAIEFDGAKSLVSVEIDLLDVGKNQSFSAWFKTDLVENKHAQVFHADFATGFRFWMWIMRSGHGAAGKLGFGYRNGGLVGLEMTSKTKLNDDDWHHTVGVFDGAAELATLYVDGVQAAQKSTKDTVFHASDGNLCIGGNCGGSAGSIWLGVIDEVAVFNTALKEADAKEIMNEGLEGALGLTPVEPAGKLATIWGAVKAQQ